MEYKKLVYALNLIETLNGKIFTQDQKIEIATILSDASTYNEEVKALAENIESVADFDTKGGREDNGYYDYEEEPFSVFDASTLLHLLHIDQANCYTKEKTLMDLIHYREIMFTVKKGK